MAQFFDRRKLLASRYRKEKTGSMSEDDLRRVEREICRVKDLEKRRAPNGEPSHHGTFTWIEYLVKYHEIPGISVIYEL